MLTGQDMVDKMDVLVDCWLQLAKGLLDKDKPASKH
jgi:hypothetical protein